MSYEKQNFVDNQILTADNLNHIENGIENLEQNKADKTEIPSIEGLASETYVRQQVAGIIDSAPETLNTLNELAQALGDDPNFATTIANQIGQKAEKSELFSKDYNDLSNKPTIPSIEGLASEAYVNNKLANLQLVKITQAEYDALENKDANTLYIIIE